MRTHGRVQRREVTTESIRRGVRLFSQCTRAAWIAGLSVCRAIMPITLSRLRVAVRGLTPMVHDDVIVATQGRLRGKMVDSAMSSNINRVGGLNSSETLSERRPRPSRLQPREIGTFRLK